MECSVFLLLSYMGPNLTNSARFGKFCHAPGEKALNSIHVWEAGIAQFLGKLLPAIRRLAADCSKKLKVGEREKGEGNTSAKGNMLRKHNKRPLPF